MLAPPSGVCRGGQTGRSSRWLSVGGSAHGPGRRLMVLALEWSARSVRGPALLPGSGRRSCLGQRGSPIEQRCDLVLRDEGIEFEEYARIFFHDERAQLLSDER